MKITSRAEYLAQVMSQAEYVLDDPEMARLWMNKPHPELAGRTPVAVASTESGALEVEELLGKLFYGLPV